MNCSNLRFTSPAKFIASRACRIAPTCTGRALLFSLLLAVTFLGLASSAFGQMQWSSYDNGGNLVTANVATGGDVASATSVTFTIPANSTNFFVTKSFTPINLAQVNASAVVTFKFSASAGLTGVAQRTVAWGLYNSAGTAGLADDIGMLGGWNGAGPFVEGLFHASGSAYLFAGTSPGLGQTKTGAPSNGTTYTNQIRLFYKSAPNGIALGTSSSTLAAAGVAMNGADLTARGFTNPSTGTNTFDEFAFMFNNTTASPVTVTLSAIGLGNSLTWDASGANPTVPTDGSGNWSSTNANWSSGVGGAFGASDSIWSPGYNAVIGANNGAAGTITITDPSVTVSNITFNAAGSGSYNIVSNTLTLTGTPTITVAGGVSATNSALLGGTGFTKAGSGLFVMNPTNVNTYAGPITVNAGTLYGVPSSFNAFNGDVTVNSGATLLLNGSTPGGMNPMSTLTINGGAVTNISLGGTATESHNLVVFNNGGILAYGPANSGQINATNFDFRSGLSMFPKMIMTTNFSVKSTPGTMDYIGRPSSTGPQGLILTLLGGTMLLDYPLVAPNGDTTQGGAKFQQSGVLTLGGGRLLGQFNSTASRTEIVLSTTIWPGATSLVLTNVTTGTYAFTLNALNRSVGGAINFRTGGSGSVPTIKTTSINVNGILGGWATWAESDWAVGSPSGSSTTVSAYSAYTTSTDPTTWVAANNVSLTANPIANVPGSTSINSLKLGGTSAVTLNGSLTLSSGGLLVTGSGANSITGGTLLGGSGTDLSVQQYSSGDLTVGSTLADNGSASSLTKSGTGKLILNPAANTMTGTNYLNGGTVEVSDLSFLAGGPVVMNNGTLRYTGSDVTGTRRIVLNGVGGTIDVGGSAKLTQTTAITGSGGLNSPVTPGLNLGDWGGLTKMGSGTLMLMANNVYNGATVVSNGVLSINGTNSLTGTSGLTNYSGGGTFTVYGGTLGGTGMISGLVTIKNGGTISPGNSVGTLTLAAGLTLESGSTNLFEVTNNAAGDLLVVQGNLTIGANCTIAVSALGTPFEPATNTLITYTGTKTGSFNPTVVVAGGSTDGSVSLDESTPGQIKLVVVPQVAITKQPADDIISVGSNELFSVTATGNGTLYYQWYRYADSSGNSPVPQSGATSSTFAINNAQSSDTGFYGVVVTNNYNSVTSRVASLTVGNVLPVLSGPTNTTAIAGNNVTFSTRVVLGNPYPDVQWQTNGINVAGATSTNLTLNSVPAGYDGMIVSVIATNLAGSVTNSATLSVIVTPAISPQPTNLMVNVGDTAVFTSGATGTPIPSLQWYKNGLPISGQTGSTLTIASAQGSDIGLYDLVATNIAGVATSSVVKLTVKSTTLAATAFSPTNGSTGICYDTPLYITFNGPVSIVNSGRVMIYNTTNQVTPVDVIDMGANTVVVSGGINLTNNIQPHSLFPGDPTVINYFPVIITGNTAAIYPHLGVMTSNQTYYVTIDNGIVADSTGAYFAGISDTNAWRFTTKPTGPANPTNIVVAADGSGDFVTVQGAVNSSPLYNVTPRIINIRNGNYVEIVNVSSNNNLTFRGQSRSGTVVGYPNNNNLTGTTAARMAFKVNASDIKLENLTITNGTPQGGQQAEALLIYNNGLRCVVNNCDIVSRQDTILINASTSQGYFYNCRVIGNFDYVWGVGIGYFDHCVFHTLTNSLSGSYNLTAARTQTAGSVSTNTPWVNPNGTLFSANGFSFVNCVLEADSGVTGITLAGSNGTAGGLDSWAFCQIDTNAYVSPSTALSNTYVFWQYSNKHITGAGPAIYTNVQTIGVTNNDPRLLAVTNIQTWFYGWIPMMAPNILTNPASQSINGGQSATFTVSATGIPNPTYQWLSNGIPITGQTGSSLTINNANANNAAAYSVVVSNASGSVTSSAATLTVGNTAPTLTPVSDQTVNVGVTVNVNNMATDPDMPAQTLTFTLPIGPGSVNPATGQYTWRPPVASADTTTGIAVVVTDNGSPNLSATNRFNVIVNPVTQPTTSSAAYANGQFSMTVNGQAGPDYIVQASTNLLDWESLITNSSPILPFNYTNSANMPSQFYRILLAP
jgi:autotransporter-associated beta strand protein